MYYGYCEGSVRENVHVGAVIGCGWDDYAKLDTMELVKFAYLLVVAMSFGGKK